MANYRAENVLVVDTTETRLETLNIEAIKIKAGGATATLTIANSQGDLVYEGSAASNTMVLDSEVCMRLPNGAILTISGTGAKAYIYLAVE